VNDQQHCDSRFRYRRAAFYNGLKSKVGLAAANLKVALRINLNIDGSGVFQSPAVVNNNPVVPARS